MIQFDPVTEAFYQECMESAPVGIVIVHAGSIYFVNRTFAALTGQNVEQLIGQSPTALLHADSASQAQIFDQMQQDRIAQPIRVRLRFQTASGFALHGDAKLIPMNVASTPPQRMLMLRVGEPADHRFRWTDGSDPTRQIIDSTPAAMFVLNEQCVITHWNRAMEMITGVAAERMVGRPEVWRAFFGEERRLLGELVITGEVESDSAESYQGKLRRSPLIPGAYEAEDFFPRFGPNGRWLAFTVAPIHNHIGQVHGSITSVFDVTEQKIAESALITLQVELEELIDKRTEQLASARDELQLDLQRRLQTERELLARNAELTELTHKWSQTQAALLQSEKMASVGQLAAGVAHEINNPIGYVHSNFTSLETYLEDMFHLLDAYEAIEILLPADDTRVGALKTVKQQIELDFVRADVPNLMSETSEGITRVRKIVQDLRDFSRADSQQEWEYCDLHRCLDSTLNIVANEIKYHADVKRDYGDIPDIECRPSQVSQVFLNLLVNAAHASEGRPRGTITLKTRVVDDHVIVEISDTGKGIAKDTLGRIFDPFFTTKPIGKGTGLGLSLSYGIVQKHLGRFEVDSEVDVGTTFRVVLPVQQLQQQSQLEAVS